MGTRVRVFLNAKSGGTDANAEGLTRMFAAHDCACIVTDLDRSVDLAGLARSEPEEVAFIAAGGDGTVNCVAAVVAGTARKLGVLPVGTLNHFAKDLALPQELEAAVAVAAGSVSRAVDAAEVNGRIFVNNSSIGAYPLMVLDRERMKRTGLNRWASLALASAKSFLRFRRRHVKLEIDGRARRFRTPLVFVGNNEYCMDGFRMGKRERLDQGELALFLAHDITRVGVLRMIFAALRGRVKEAPEYEEVKATQVTITPHKRRLRVSLDGEVKRMHSPLRYSIKPGALQVLCPAEVAG